MHVHANIQDTQNTPYPADGKQKTWLAGADSSKTVSESPVEEVFGDKGNEGEPHGSGKHVEHPGHVVYIELTGHHLILLIVANSCQPLSF